MKNRKHLVVGNWKMNPISPEEARGMINLTKKLAREMKRTDVVVCPPFPYLNMVRSAGEKKFYAGVQDVFWQPAGSFTGEVSAEMVRQNGAKFAIIGHSERRELGETDEIVSKKAVAVLGAGLSAIVCVGEKIRDNSGDYLEFLRKQVSTSLAGVKKKNVSDLIIAYEPVWAIGRNFSEAMKPSDIEETALFLKKVLSEIFGKDWLQSLKILYGGSVNWENAGFIVGGGGVDGLLVGRESLSRENYPKLLKSVDAVPI